MPSWEHDARVRALLAEAHENMRDYFAREDVYRLMLAAHVFQQDQEDCARLEREYTRGHALRDRWHDSPIETR